MEDNDIKKSVKGKNFIIDTRCMTDIQKRLNKC